MKRLVKESLLEYSPYVPPEGYYTVVSYDHSMNKYGIEGDFEARDEEDAIQIAKEGAREYGAKRIKFEAFLMGSEELQEFIDNHPFID